MKILAYSWLVIGFLLLSACEQQSKAADATANAVESGVTSAVDTVTEAAENVAAVVDPVVPESAAVETQVEAAVVEAGSVNGELPPLQAESTGIIESLPEQYPAHWILVQDGAFFNMLDGRVIVVDASSDDPAKRYKGMINSSFLGAFQQARTRPEMYVAETFLSRGSRGDRTDVFTIYDKQNLSVIDEITLPAKRASSMPTIYHVSLVDDEKLALVFNFTPAASISVVDLVEREFMGEVPIPGCALSYPMSGRGFSTICADGTLLSANIGASIEEVSTERTTSFFDIEADPLIEKPIQTGGMTYFPSFKGNVYPINTSGRVAVPGAPWSLLGDGDEGWRPGGLQMSAVDSAGRLYFLMHPEGYEGSHKDPGAEVWVFDAATQKRVDRIKLELPAISISVTRGDKPLMVTTNINLAVDVYDVASGAYQRTLEGIGSQTPFLLHGAQ